MELICYVYPGWEPRIRPASHKREWMDATPESFAYRCLPLKIANAHGWEVLSPCGFKARWDGRSGTEGVEIVLDPGARPEKAPVSLFGQGTITFHVEGLLRTEPGWNLWVGGPPNEAKDGIAALGGVVETDWSPYTFTMNWRFTRPGQWVRFEEDEPICFFFPVERKAIESVEPRLVPIGEAPEVKAQFERWSASRDAFQAKVRANPPSAPADKWQKLYYRGLDAEERPGTDDHQSKVRAAPFRAADGAAAKVPEPRRCPAAAEAAAPASPAALLALRRREWALHIAEEQRGLSLRASGIHRVEGLDTEDFLDYFYAPARPAIILGELAGWPALERWTPDYLKAKVGGAEIEYQGGRDSSATFEIDKDAHKRAAPFDRFIDMITAEGAGNDAYLTAYNSARNAAALAPLEPDLGFPDKFLTREVERPNGMMWIGPGRTFTPLHHDLTNNLLAQLRGRKRIVMAPPSETGKLYNSRHVFSDIGNIGGGKVDLQRFPLAAKARLFELVLEPGELLYIPVGWWHQVEALDFSVTITYTNFRWPNEAWRSFPEG